MATLKTEIYKIQNNDLPGQKTEIGDYIGRVRQLYFELSPEEDTGATDEVLVAKIPPGARVIDFHVSAASGAGTFGWSASTDGKEEEDVDGFATALSDDARMDGAVAGFCKRFASQVDAIITLSGAITAGENVLKGYINYVID